MYKRKSIQVESSRFSCIRAVARPILNGFAVEQLGEVPEVQQSGLRHVVTVVQPQELEGQP